MGLGALLLRVPIPYRRGVWVRLLIYAVLAWGLARLMARVGRAWRERIAPLPERWRLLAAVDPALEHGVALRQRLVERARAEGVDRAAAALLIADVDAALGVMADLADVRVILERALARQDAAGLGGSVVLVAPAPAPGGERSLAAIHKQPSQIRAAVATAVVILDELEAAIAQRSAGMGRWPALVASHEAQTLRHHTQALRTRLEAQRAVQAFLDELPGGGAP